MKRILVSGAGGSASYNFILSLRKNQKKEKFYLVGMDTSPYHIELSPVDKRYIVPKFSDRNYTDKINEIIKKEKIDFFHIQPDGEVYFISKNRNKINTKTFLPDHKAINLCQNKMKFNSFMKKNGISVPEAYFIDSKDALRKSLKILLKKNDKAWLRAIKGAGARAALPVTNYNQAQGWIDYWSSVKGLGYSDFMVSEFLSGKEYAFQSLWQNGNLVASQARERIEYIFGNLTPSGQSSSPSVARTVNSEEIDKLVSSAIKKIDPNANGVFCADLKTDSNGHIKIIEINAGRFFTTSYFFSAVGLNMPYYYVKLGMGEGLKSLGKIKSIEEDIYWIRMIDMGFKAVKSNKWSSEKL
jgi:predicted ATP-grasp superfamily ATP-dependent carboligase